MHTGTHVPTHSPGAFHTQSHVQTRTRSAAHSLPSPVSAGAEGQGRWPRKIWTLQRPLPCDLTHPILSERGGGAGLGEGEADEPSPLFPSPFSGLPDFSSPKALLPDQTFPSLTSPPASPLPPLPPPPQQRQLPWNPELSPQPPREGGREDAPPVGKGGAAWLARAGARREGCEKAPAGSQSAESRAQGPRLPFPWSVGEEPGGEPLPL